MYFNRKLNKKGFTLVELVIVIVIIAVLAAVIIPMFISVTKKANLSADMQAVYSMNEQLLIAEAEGNKPEDISTVKTILNDAGYDMDKYSPLSAGHEVYWVKSENRVVLYDTEESKVVYPEEFTELTLDNNWYTFKTEITDDAIVQNGDNTRIDAFNEIIEGTNHSSIYSVLNAIQSDSDYSTIMSRTDYTAYWVSDQNRIVMYSDTENAVVYPAECTAWEKDYSTWTKLKEDSDTLPIEKNVLKKLGTATDYEEQIVVPHGVTEISQMAFSGVTDVVSIVLPDTVKEIGGYAFNSCTNLKYINIPDGIQMINDRTFVGCNNLEKIILPDSIEVIGSGAFLDCTSLKEITLPENLWYISQDSFKYCTSLTSVTIPEEVNLIYANAFYGCTSLKSAIFKNCDGWQFVTEDNEDNTLKYNISCAELSDPSTAAQYLVNGYLDYYGTDTWKRS